MNVSAASKKTAYKSYVRKYLSSPSYPYGRLKLFISTGMRSLKKELERTGVQMDGVKERYHIEQPEQITEEIYKRVMTCRPLERQQGEWGSHYCRIRRG